MQNNLLKKLSGRYRALSGKQRRCLAALAALASAAAVLCLLRSPESVGAANTRQLPIYSVERDQKMVALSFDAAWGNEDTQTLIDILGKYNVKVTFFVVGDWVDKYPESVLALHEAGHEVMNHSDSHAHFNTLTADQIVADISSCCDKIESVTGVRPTLFRPPYGEYDDHVIAAVRSMGIEPVQWDVDSLDWKGLSAQDIYSRVTQRVSAGSIVLFHNAAKHTPEALEDIVRFLIADGYQIVPVGQLILTGDYTIDHTGRQFPA